MNKTETQKKLLKKKVRIIWRDEQSSKYLNESHYKVKLIAQEFEKLIFNE